jgi:hypothetical protein
MQTFDTSGRTNIGRALETAVFNELEKGRVQGTDR